MIFMISCLIAFALGNTFVTIAIVTSVALPLVLRSTGETTLDAAIVQQVRFASIGAILSGSIWGSHMSLVSDTTIMAATGAGCDHIDHVHTQLPYAGFVGLTALVVGFLPTGFGVSPWLSYAAGLVSILVVTFIVCDKAKGNLTTQTAAAEKPTTAKVRLPAPP
jgi:Na+/H+ antiporter NhaC